MTTLNEQLNEQITDLSTSICDLYTKYTGEGQSPSGREEGGGEGVDEKKDLNELSTLSSNFLEEIQMLDKSLQNIDYKNIKDFLSKDELDTLKITYKKEIDTDKLQGSIVKNEIDKLLQKLFPNYFFD